MILLVDIEATCGDSIPKDERETIEIGAVLCEDNETYILDTYETLIQPTLHGTLTDFCVDLTGIRQVEVDEARIFSEAWKDFMRWVHQQIYPRTYISKWMSWGRFDRVLLEADCKRNNVLYGMPEHFDLSRVFHMNAKRRKGRRGALRYFGVESGGRNHRGLDDAKDVAKLLELMTSMGWIC